MKSFLLIDSILLIVSIVFLIIRRNPIWFVATLGFLVLAIGEIRTLKMEKELEISSQKHDKQFIGNAKDLKELLKPEEERT